MVLEKSRIEIPGKFRNVVLEKDGKISWTDRVRKEKVLYRVKEDRNIEHKTRRRKAKWIGLILHRNCLLQHGTEGNCTGKDM